MFSIETNIKEIIQFYRELPNEIEKEAVNDLKRVADNAVKRASKAIRTQNPSLVGSYWEPLSPRYLRTLIKTSSEYPTETLKLHGRMMRNFYKTGVSGSLRWGGLSINVSNRSPYFSLMELGGVSEQGWEVPARPSLITLARYSIFVDEASDILSKHIDIAIDRAAKGAGL